MSSVIAKAGLLGARVPTPIHPTDPFSASQLLAIEAAFERAWQHVRQAPDLAIANEVSLNTAMVAELHEIHAADTVAGFTVSVASITRGSEFNDAEGERLEKRPDITIGPSAMPGHSKLNWALFVECKIVDASHSITRYRTDGLARFVKGTYASAVCQSMMVAYIRGQHRLPGSLQRMVDRHKDALAWVEPIERPRGSRGWCSRHRRASRPDIGVVHLWLEAG